jgi:N-acetylmuramoyl-L-alanine amidase
VRALLLAVALLAAVQRPPMLTVVSPRGERRVAVLAERGFPAVAADRLGAVLSIERAAAPPGAASLRVLDRPVDFLLDVGYFRFADEVYTLAHGPYIARDSLFLPLQFAVEYLPRLLEPRFRYDAERARLEELAEGTAAAPAPAGSAGAARRTAVPRRPRVIAVDPGHGGVDHGMVGPIGRNPFLREKDVVLAVSRYLAAELESRGFRAVLTRTRDTLIALGDRGRIAGERGADLFLSVHVNAANPRWRNAASARGFETYYLAEARTEDARRVERMENASVRFETTAQARRGDPLSFILRDLAQNEHLRESSRLAELVQGTLAGVHPGENRGVKQAGFMVLATSYMPAVLVELGFGSNRAEAQLLTTPAEQRRLARAIADGVERYLAEYERRLAAAGGP